MSISGFKLELNSIKRNINFLLILKKRHSRKKKLPALTTEPIEEEIIKN